MRKSLVVAIIILLPSSSSLDLNVLYKGGQDHCTNFIDGETEVQRGGKVTYLKPSSRPMAKLGIETRFPES